MKLRLILSLWMALAVSALAAEAPKTKVLLITGGHGFATNEFLKVFTENPQITLTHANHAKGTASAYDREDLFDYDAVVLYDMPKEISDAQKTRFVTLTEKGIGLVVLHHALVSYQHWPDYERIIGGRYPEADGKGGVVTDNVGYEHDVKYQVHILEKDHPVTKDVGDFDIHDEIYWGFRTGRDIKPLITTDHPKSGKPLAWERTEGKSRIIYLQLGHGPEAFANPNYRKVVALSIQYVSRRK
ncbi:MAG TPA: ThuA domain-containing protein [Verrucomicrobiae bacterium]|nr:ThuA domain-containing protein [Verrucomicrobiae bacterium]